MRVRIRAVARNEFESGGTDPALSAGNLFLVVPVHFLALKVQLIVLVSAFVMASTLWSVSRLLFFYTHSAPRAQPFVNVHGARAPVPHRVGATNCGVPGYMLIFLPFWSGYRPIICANVF